MVQGRSDERQRYEADACGAERHRDMPLGDCYMIGSQPQYEEAGNSNDHYDIASVEIAVAYQ
jgi:hypothetical protein